LQLKQVFPASCRLDHSGAGHGKRDRCFREGRTNDPNTGYFAKAGGVVYCLASPLSFHVTPHWFVKARALGNVK
jgi:hypothetical protein